MAGRRFIVAIGVSTYDDASLNLAAVPDDVAKITQWFATGSPIPHEVALGELRDSPTNEQIRTKLADWLEARDPGDFIVVYLAAHGDVDAGTAYVLGRDSARERLAGRAIDGDTIGRIIGQSPPHNVLLIIDACVAGDLGVTIQYNAIRVSRQRNTRDPFRQWSQAVVCSTFGRDPAHDGRFAQAFLNVVTHERWTGALYPYLNFGRENRRSSRESSN